MQLKGPYEPGTWTYNISVAKSFVGKTAMIVVNLNVKNEVLAQGLLEEKATLGSLDGNQTKAVKAFAYVQKSGETALETSTYGVLCKTWIQDEPLNFTLKDNGLTSKYDTEIPRNLQS